MTRKSILAWTLAWTLTALLLVAWVALAEAAPRSREPAVIVPGLTPTEQYCRGLGLFAYRRTNEYYLGYSFTDVMSMTRRFAAENHLDATTLSWHEALVRTIYASNPTSAAIVRQATEEACMQWARTLHTPPPAPRTTTPDARLRY